MLHLRSQIDGRYAGGGPLHGHMQKSRFHEQRLHAPGGRKDPDRLGEILEGSGRGGDCRSGTRHDPEGVALVEIPYPSRLRHGELENDELRAAGGAS